MLNINDLHAAIYDEKQNLKPILQGLNLNIGSGQVHVIMGPNGSGKSTLANILAGRENYLVSQGSVEFDGQNLLNLTPEQRANAGVFMAFQYPVEIPGVNNTYFLRTALNCQRKQKGLPELDAADFIGLIKHKIAQVGLSESFLHRAVNEGFSGGEKKRNEILQMLVLGPKFIILDETDSGLDIDALQMVAKCVNTLRNDQRSILIVTHYQRMLDYIVPDFIHVMANGKIIKSGDRTLALELEAKGYAWVASEAKL
jgi:Fe-S cluster assembly ATP-binding protein